MIQEKKFSYLPDECIPGSNSHIEANIGTGESNSLVNFRIQACLFPMQAYFHPLSLGMGADAGKVLSDVALISVILTLCYPVTPVYQLKPS